jgi:acyl-CoA synthetase (NDP forming)
MNQNLEIKQIFDEVRQQGRTRLTEAEAKKVLASAGLVITREDLASSEDEAAKKAEQIGFPVVLKVASADILHKSDAGGVKVGLADAEAVRSAYRDIMETAKEKHPSANIQGVLVQEMVEGGIETIVGVANRPPFGPVVAFGLGGVFVELLKDVTFRLAPIDEAGATEMLADIEGARMLDGYRGQPAANKAELAKVIARLSGLAIAFNKHVEELDINPLVVKGDRVVALDALITLKENGVEDQPAPEEKVGEGNGNDIRAVLEPRSIAVIGASSNPTKTGHVLFKNIVVNGFPGKVYPINPKADEILGIKAYPKILDVPDDIDVVFFLLPGQFVPTLYEDCKKKGVKAAVIIAAGFAEVGEEGAKQQKMLVDLVKSTGVRCLGPNSIGFINMDQQLVASFILFENWEDGSIALAGQSGIFAGAVADQVMNRTVQRIGIGKSIIMGNKIDLDESDFLEWSWKDPKTEIVALHLEGMQDPRRFLSLANKVKRDMPIIVLKPGRTEPGARASASHTGSLALDDALVDHAFRQYGVTRAYDLEEFLEFMKAFSYQPLPKRNRIGIVTFSGANGVMASDELSERGFHLADFEPETYKRIEKFLPEWQPVTNPLDLWAAMGSGNRLAHEEGLLSVLDDKNVDAVLMILLALANADFDGIREVFANAMERHPDKPIYVVALGGKVKERWLKEIEGLKVPVFENTHIAVKAFTAALRYAQDRERLQPDPLLP